MCLEFLPHAQRLCADWKEPCNSLGVPLSDTQCQAPSQLPSYAGFDFDTVRGPRGLVLTQAAKLEQSLACLDSDSWLGAESLPTMSRRASFTAYRAGSCIIRMLSGICESWRRRCIAASGRCPRRYTTRRSRSTTQCVTWQGTLVM